MDEREPNLHLGRSGRGGGGRVEVMKNEIGYNWRKGGGRMDGGRRDKKGGHHLRWFGLLFSQSQIQQSAKASVSTREKREGASVSRDEVKKKNVALE